MHLTGTPNNLYFHTFDFNFGKEDIIAHSQISVKNITNPQKRDILCDPITLNASNLLEFALFYYLCIITYIKQIIMKHILLAACAVAILSGCGSQGKQAAPTENPFLSEYTTPFQVPPFDQIKMEHYKPAFLQGMEDICINM